MYFITKSLKSLESLDSYFPNRKNEGRPFVNKNNLLEAFLEPFLQRRGGSDDLAGGIKAVVSSSVGRHLSKDSLGNYFGNQSSKVHWNDD